MHRPLLAIAPPPPASPAAGAMLVLALSLADAARACGLSESTIRRAVAAGRLRQTKIFGATRYRVCDIEEFLARCAAETAAPSGESDNTEVGARA